MEFRKSLENDINTIMNIFNQAQLYLKEQGVNQWQNNYPNREVVKNDIDNGHSYVLIDEGVIIGTVALMFDGEKTYDNIYNGSWNSNERYTTIHRIAVDNKYKRLGIGTIILDKVEDISLHEGIHSIRVDTHEDNLSMQRLLEKNGYIYCGVIFLEDKSKRIAYEKIII